MNADVDEAVAIIEGDEFEIEISQSEKCKQQIGLDKLLDKLALQLKHIPEIKELYFKEGQNKHKVYVYSSEEKQEKAQMWLEGWFSALNQVITDKTKTFEIEIIFINDKAPKGAKKIK
jgi:hypothetical protein